MPSSPGLQGGTPGLRAVPFAKISNCWHKVLCDAKRKKNEKKILIFSCIPFPKMKSEIKIAKEFVCPRPKAGENFILGGGGLEPPQICEGGGVAERGSKGHKLISSMQVPPRISKGGGLGGAVHVHKAAPPPKCPNAPECVAGTL